MAIDAVRLAIMAALGDVPGVTVPADPIPNQIEDKTIVVYPRPGSSTPGLHRAKNGGIVINARDTMVIEYHRVVPIQAVGSVWGDVTEMTETLRMAVWAQMVPGAGKFDGTVDQIHAVTTIHMGGLGWNEFTAGVRLGVDLTHSSIVT